MNKRNKLLIILAGLIAIIILCVLTIFNTYSRYQDTRAICERQDAIKLNTIDISLYSEGINNYNPQREINQRGQSEYLSYYEEAGILFASHIESWNNIALRNLAKELFSNAHGDEMYYIDKVVVSSSDNEEKSCYLTPSYHIYNIPVALTTFFPEDAVFTIREKKYSIYLYGANVENSVEDFALELSYTYGSHFAQHCLNLTGTDVDKETEYYKYRAAYTDEIITDINTGEYDEKRLLTNMAIYDYVCLMGSDAAKKVYVFEDSYFKALRFSDNHGKGEYSYYKECVNGIPILNPAISMPHLVEGLPEYFYSFSDEQTPVFTQVGDIGTLNLEMENSFDNRHILRWEQPYTDPDIAYTLIAYDTDDNIVAMVKTTYGDEESIAHLGENRPVWSYFEPYEYKIFAFYYETGAPIRFRISIIFPDGTIVLTDPIDFKY